MPELINSSHLDGQYAAFGKVIEGIEVVDEIASVKTDWNDKRSAETACAPNALTCAITSWSNFNYFGVNYG